MGGKLKLDEWLFHPADVQVSRCVHAGVYDLCAPQMCTTELNGSGARWLSGDSKMRWQGRERSQNVEDRRGMRPAGLAIGGGGVIALLIAVVAMFLGADPQSGHWRRWPATGPTATGDTTGAGSRRSIQRVHRSRSQRHRKRLDETLSRAGPRRRVSTAATDHLFGHRSIRLWHGQCGNGALLLPGGSEDLH